MAGDDVMGRNKITAKTQQRKCPHWVDVAQSHHAERTPEEYRSLSDRLTAMLAWHQQRGLQHQWGRGGISNTRWCFAKVTDADAFAQDFGGTRVDTPWP
jgi:hypothetical protein